MRMMTALIAAVTFASGLSLHGQEPVQPRPATPAQQSTSSMHTVRHAAALAAASRALHYCTGLFSAEMSLDRKSVV